MMGKQAIFGCVREVRIQTEMGKEVIWLMDGIFIEIIIGILRAVAEALGKGKD